MKHYVVIYDWAVDHISESGVEITAVVHSLEEAKEIFAKAVESEKIYAEANNWTIYTDSDVEFDAGEEGYYAAEHAHFYIQGVM